MYASRDVSKINTKHPLYNKPQSPKARYAARRNWLLFQLRASIGNLSTATTQMEYAFREVEGKSPELRQKHNELVFDVQWHIDEFKKLEKRLIALTEVSKEKDTR